MKEQELKKLKRIDLLTLLIEQCEENQRLKQQLEQAQRKLEERRIVIEKAGSIAQAALQLNGVFEVAENAAKQYLESIQQLQKEQEQLSAKLEEQSKEKARKMLQETEEKCRILEEQVRQKAQDSLSQCTSPSPVLEGDGRKKGQLFRVEEQP